MLKGLLPTLRAKINQNWKNPQNQKQDLQNQGQNEAFRLTSLNLLSNFQPVAPTFRKHEDAVSNLSKIIVTLSLVLGFLLVLNYFLFVHITRLKVEQDRLSNNILFKAESEKMAIGVDKKVAYYKELVRLRKLLSPRVSFVYKNITEGVELNKLRITYPNFEITAKAKNIYDFTKLITNYLSGEYVSEIVLKSANLDTQTKEYEFTIGGVFK